MGLEWLGRLLIVMGGIIVLVGLVLVLAPRIPYLGRLPGDIFVQRDNVTIFVPIATMIIISIVLTILLNVVARLLR